MDCTWDGPHYCRCHDKLAAELVRQTALAAHRAAQAEPKSGTDSRGFIACPTCGFTFHAPNHPERARRVSAAQAGRDEACPGCATWQQVLDQHRRQEHGEQARDYQPDYEGALTIVDEQANRLADLLLKTRQQRDEAERLLEQISDARREQQLALSGALGVVANQAFRDALDAIDQHVAARRAARGEADRA